LIANIDGFVGPLKALFYAETDQVHRFICSVTRENIGDMLNGVYVKDGNQPKMFLGVVNS